MDLKWIDMGGPRIWDMYFFHPKLRFVIGCIAHHDATTFLDSSEGRIEHLQGRNRQLEAARTSLFIDNHWYTLCFLDHIWYSLEHTGNARTYRVSLEHTRITPRTYQEATNDYTGSGLRVILPGYTRILAQGIVIGYAKTPLDCPQMPSRKKKRCRFFLETGMRSGVWVRISETFREFQQEKKMACWKHRELRTTPGQLVERPCWDVERLYWGRGTPIPGHGLGDRKKIWNRFCFFWWLFVLTFGGLFVPSFNEQTRGRVRAHKWNSLQKTI